MSSAPQRILGLLVGAALLLGACDRAEVRPLAPGGGPLDDATPSVLVVQIRPSYFATISATSGEELQGWTSPVWSQSSIDDVLADGTLLVFGPLDAAFDLQGLDIETKPNALHVSATYASPPVRTALRLSQPGGTVICRLDVDLGTRTLAFDLVPRSAPGRVSWETTMTSSFASDGLLRYEATETCAYDLATLDWTMLSARVDALLAGKAASDYMAALRDTVLEQLALPGGGFVLVPGSSGFFSPRDLTLATALTNEAPWSGEPASVDSVLGLRLAYDGLITAAGAPCAEEITAPEMPLRSLLSATAPRLTPAGLPYDALVVMQEGFVDHLLHQLTVAGYGCADLAFDRPMGLDALSNVFPELDNITAFDFGGAGRLRVQLLAPPELSVTGSRQLSWTMPAARFEIYGESEELFVRVASMEASVRIDTLLSVSTPGVLRFEPVQVSAATTRSDVSVLEAEGLTVDVDDLAARVAHELFATSMAVPIPAPFGLRLDVLHVVSEDNALWFYLELVGP